MKKNYQSETVLILFSLSSQERRTADTKKAKKIHIREQKDMVYEMEMKNLSSVQHDWPTNCNRKRRSQQQIQTSIRLDDI